MPWLWIVLAITLLVAIIVTIILLGGDDPVAPKGLAPITVYDLKEDLR